MSTVTRRKRTSSRMRRVPRTHRLTLSKLTAAKRALGAATATEAIDVRSSLPITVDISLNVSSASTALKVTASPDLVETDPSTHQDVDRSAFEKLPAFNPGNQLSQVITNSTGGWRPMPMASFIPWATTRRPASSLTGSPSATSRTRYSPRRFRRMHSSRWS